MELTQERTLRLQSCGVTCLGPLARALLLQEVCSKDVNAGLFQCLINCPKDWCNLPGELPAWLLPALLPAGAQPVVHAEMSLSPLGW